ncbi:hypothetical protein [Clostridium beijerinckii]|uniref:Uncharacterized protein n=1 Tax=Clostridium beijerinckii TaxID=1520 RepID=A0A9Q5CRR5_CLOBE|nr:hypothetical protein [Clostridium beijerinckii]AQS06407.1 hypothetical protein CLBIJ_38540 [Clostridium beijerinckii]MBA2885783.1 hypothetical protein [Clostridium beijerinckii]MBA2900516.1 hypothetical protein [Clostridium beijerinckii]MBA2910342.1 hypothetical protein [Clostridium beijerinckii]MBA9013974.1 hypothetical protein [Clostridium beijerinckii]
MFNYKEKVTLVTEESCGIGKAYEEELASKGCHFILRSKEKLDINSFSEVF